METVSPYHQWDADGSGTSRILDAKIVLMMGGGRALNGAR